MTKIIIALSFIFSTMFFCNQAAAQDNTTDNSQGTQADLDKQNQQTEQGRELTKEQKAYLKKAKKAKEARDKKNEITRKKAQKIHDKRLSKAKSGVASKKKKYVKTHNK